MKKIHLFLILFAAAFLALANAGCSAKAKKMYHLERANRWFKLAEFDKAEIEYLNVLRADPQNAEAFGRLGEIYFDEGRFQTAAPFLFKGSQLATNDLELRVELAQIQIAVGKLKDARDNAEFVLQKNPKDADAPILLAQSSATTNEIADAQRQLQSLAKNGDSAALEAALGTLASRQHDFKTALSKFQRALALDPQSAAAYAALGNSLWTQNDLKKAETAFKSAADFADARSPLRLQFPKFELQTGDFDDAKNSFGEMTKETPDYVPGWLGLAEVALAKTNFDDCAAALKKALALDPQNVDAQVFNARLDLARGQTAKATGELEQLAKKFPQSPQIHFQLALAYLTAAQTDKAVNQLHEAANLDANFTQAVFLLAQLEMKTGDLNSAVDLLEQLTARAPDLVPAKLLLASAFRLQGDFNGALKIYRQLEKSSPKNPQFSLLAGSTFIQQKDESAAREEFNRALEIQPDNLSAQEELAELDLAAQQFSAAQSRAEKIVAKNPKVAQPQILLAKIFLAQGQTNQAEIALSKAAALQPDSAANLLLAQLYFNSRQDQKALDALNIALEKNPKDVSALMLAGIIQSDRKNFKAAADNYEKLLAINPQYSPALNNLAWIDCENLGDLDRAYDLAQRARQLLPTDPSTADTLGWILFKKGQILPASKLFQDAATGLADNPQVEFHLGVANYMLGNENAARDALQLALDSNQKFSGRGECENCLFNLNVNPKTADAETRGALEKRISEKPDDPIAFARLAAIYQRDKNFAKAAALCQTVLKASPQNVKAMILLAQLDAATDPQKAFDLAKTAYQLKPDDADVCAMLGKILLQIGGNDSWAFSLLQQASQNQPDNSQTLFDFANAAFCAGKFSDAQTAMQGALQAGLDETKSADAKNFLDLISLTKNPEQAAATESRVDEILNSNPGNAPALFAEGIIDTQKNDAVGAERAYEKLLSRHPDCAPAQKNLAILYAQNLVEPDKAYPVALKARESFPDDSAVARALGLILFQQGNYPRAADLFKTISDSTSADAELFYCLGISEFHLKNFADSRASLQRALTLNLSGQQAADARETLAELK